MSVLRAENLSKWYGDVIALNDVSFELEPGITGLLGPNGAGKSTLVGLAMGLVRPSAGSLRVLGLAPGSRELAIRAGYVPEGEPPWRDHSVLGAAVFHGRLGGLSRSEAEAAARRALADVGLDREEGKRVRHLSMGMRQRLKIALVLLHDPELLILDEPLRGTDPVTRRELVDLIRRLDREGRSALVSTHVLEDLEAMTSRMLLLHHGRLFAHGTVGEVRDLLESIPRSVYIASNDVKGVGRLVWDLPSVLAVESFERGVVARTREPQRFYEELQAAVLAGELAVTTVRALDEDLASTFKYLVGSA